MRRPQVISTGTDFYTSVQKMHRALTEFRVRGVKTNLPFLQNVMTHPEFLTGSTTTAFIEKHPELFEFERSYGAKGNSTAQIMNYLADVAVNGPSHPGAVGPRCSKEDPMPLPSMEGLPVPPGWRNVLLTEGPEGFARAVRAHQASARAMRTSHTFPGHRLIRGPPHAGAAADGHDLARRAPVAAGHAPADEGHSAGCAVHRARAGAGLCSGVLGRCHLRCSSQVCVLATHGWGCPNGLPHVRD